MRAVWASFPPGIHGHVVLGFGDTGRQSAGGSTPLNAAVGLGEGDQRTTVQQTLIAHRQKVENLLPCGLNSCNVVE